MTHAERDTAPSSHWFSSLTNRLSGLGLAALFYTAIYWFPVPFLERYFLGHPVAIAATILFCIALAQLGSRFLQLQRGRRQMSAVHDEELVPHRLHSLLTRNGLAASHELTTDSSLAVDPHASTAIDPRTLSLGDRIGLWTQHLEELPRAIRQTELVTRIDELLGRQSRRGHTDQLSDDIRDVGDREADADHDALQFVRIIVWAIPMLGFLGTVIGITQTLGGLDFTDGAAAVERLKSGLYVAFDTTALGLVLSVVAIFLQFPVEKLSREILAQTDARVGYLVPAVLSDGQRIDTDNPAVALRQMTAEISSTVRESVHHQAELWRNAIDEAHGHWREAAHESTTQLQNTLQNILGDSLAVALEQHADAMRQIQREGADQIDHRWQQWQTALSDNARILLSHQKALLQQGEQFAESHQRARELTALQTQLDANLLSLQQSVRTIDEGIERIDEAQTISQAMLTLARAVDLLSARLPDTPEADSHARQRPRARRDAA